MSLLSAFTTAAHGIAASVIGTESITIAGGPSIAGILSESAFNRDYEAGGFEQSATLDFVIDSTAFAAAYPNSPKTYEGNKVTARGDTWRIGSVSVGASFVRLSLISSNKSA